VANSHPHSSLFDRKVGQGLIVSAQGYAARSSSVGSAPALQAQRLGHFIEHASALIDQAATHLDERNLAPPIESGIRSPNGCWSGRPRFELPVVGGGVFAETV
jgi:hypothetical protein